MIEAVLLTLFHPGWEQSYQQFVAGQLIPQLTERLGLSILESKMVTVDRFDPAFYAQWAGFKNVVLACSRYEESANQKIIERFQAFPGITLYRVNVREEMVHYHFIELMEQLG